MDTIFTYSQIILAILLTATILVQQRGSGLSSAFGGDGGAEYSTKRGAEKFFFYATIILAILFLTVSVLKII